MNEKRSRLQQRHIEELQRFAMIGIGPKVERPGVSLDEAARLRRLWHGDRHHRCRGFDQIYETDDYVCTECGKEYSDSDYQDLRRDRTRSRQTPFVREYMGDDENLLLGFVYLIVVVGVILLAAWFVRDILLAA